MLENYADRSRAVEVDDLDWEGVTQHRLPAEARRALRYMQDTETHTIIYLRELLATRAIDEPEVADFLPCWIFEEAAHGRALARFLKTSGDVIEPRPRSRMSAAEHFQERMIALASSLWGDFVAVHMTWGAINELTAVQAYHRLALLADHPVLSELLTRIARDEARHFAFYFHQARRRLSRPKVAAVARFLLRSFWSPVGSGVQPPPETRFLAGYLFSGEDGRAAARKIDQTITSLPGMHGLRLFEAWVDRATAA